MTSKRDRELARAKAERQAVRRVQRQKRDIAVKLGALAGVVLLVAISSAVAKNVSKHNSATPSASPSASSGNVLPICQEVGPIRPNTIKFSKLPANAKAGSTLQLATNCGNITIALNQAAPKTITAMSFFAKQRFFDQTQCHRLTTQGIYVLQCGDPTATGAGGPGFEYKDENLPTDVTNGMANYKRGTVAMANSGPNTNGSQFFLVYKDSPLPPNYTVWGTVTDGLNILDQVAGAGVADGSGDGNPTQRVVITRATVTP